MVIPYRKVLLACVLTALLAACATPRPGLDNGLYTPSAASRGGPVVETVATPDSADLPDGAYEPTLIPGSGKMYNTPPRRAVKGFEGDAVTLRFEQAPVTEVVHAILGDILNVPYVINQPVDGSLTIHSGGPLERDKLLPALEAVLQANGLGMVVDADGLYHVGRPESLRGVSPFIGTASASLVPGENLLIVPLNYVGAAEMADLLGPLASPENFVRVDTVRNLLILAGSRSRLEGLIDIVRTFDVDVLKGMSFGLFPLEHADAVEIEAILRSIVGGGEAAASEGSSLASRRPGRDGGQTQGRPGAGGEAQAPAVSSINMPGPLGGIVRVIAIERLNALLVVSPRAYYIEQAREWVEKLDRPRDAGNEPQLFVYPVQNGTAAHLANLLNALFGSGEVRSTARDSGVAPGLSTASSGVGSSRNEGGRALNAAAGQAQQASLSEVSLEGNVKVVADEFNNTLLIHAPRSQYQKIESALRRLDVAPTQVLIEASIMEVTLTDEFEFGLQWYFHGGLGSGRTGAGSFNPNQSGGIGPRQPGFSYTVTGAAGDVRAVLNTLANKSLVNVLSSPSIMVLDNHLAQIKVGDQQPIRSSVTTTDGGNQTESIQYKDTGVMLSVTPSVNSGGLVTMGVEQSVTDVGLVDEATGQRSFLQRDISSRVAVRSGETVVLGGLIRDNSSRGNLGVPVLKDLPLIGPLFGTTTRSNNRTELIVLITPRVMRNDEDLRAVSEQMRQRLSSSMRSLPGWTARGPLHQREEPVPPAVEPAVEPVRMIEAAPVVEAQPIPVMEPVVLPLAEEKE